MDSPNQSHAWIWVVLVILVGIVLALIGFVLWEKKFGGGSVQSSQQQQWAEAEQKRSALEAANAQAEAERAAAAALKGDTTVK